MKNHIEITEEVINKLQESLNDRFKRNEYGEKKSKKRTKKGKKAKSN
jgi:hypothetical protein